MNPVPFIKDILYFGDSITVLLPIMTLLSLLSGRSLRLVSRKYRESPISIYGNYISNACFDIRGRDSDILFIDLMKIECLPQNPLDRKQSINLKLGERKKDSNWCEMAASTISLCQVSTNEKSNHSYDK